MVGDRDQGASGAFSVTSRMLATRDAHAVYARAGVIERALIDLQSGCRNEAWQAQIGNLVGEDKEGPLNKPCRIPNTP
jgi:hypothetical protein